MLIVDEALRRRAAAKRPIRVGIVGAGYSGQRIAYQIMRFATGMEVVAIANRTIEKAQQALIYGGANDVLFVDNPTALDKAIADQRCCICDSHEVLTQSGLIDAIIDATGSVEYGALVALSSIENGKHLILMNVELDATIGPLLAGMARAKQLVYTNSDGDEPGVAMNLIRFIRSIGLNPVLAGNLKGFYDRYRNPKTQEEFAAKLGQKPQSMAHFADGTKLSMELTVLANATGFRVARQGMYGPSLNHVDESAKFFADKLIDGGMVDFLVGAAPGSGAFVIAFSEDPMHKEYLRYLKMGDGPYYTFYTPFHLPQLEIPTTVARAVLFQDATVTPIGGPVCDSISVAKRNLNPGDKLDGLGGFCVYSLIENYSHSIAEGFLPVGLSDGCIVRSKVAKDSPIRYVDVEIPDGRTIDRLRTLQDESAGSRGAQVATN